MSQLRVLEMLAVRLAVLTVITLIAFAGNSLIDTNDLSHLVFFLTKTPGLKSPHHPRRAVDAMGSNYSDSGNFDLHRNSPQRRFDLHRQVHRL
jgi:hypothetical protein